MEDIIRNLKETIRIYYFIMTVTSMLPYFAVVLFVLFSNDTENFRENFTPLVTLGFVSLASSWILSVLFHYFLRRIVILFNEFWAGYVRENVISKFDEFQDSVRNFLKDISKLNDIDEDPGGNKVKSNKKCPIKIAGFTPQNPYSEAPK